ncbi:hypothetical protein BUALT_Bualt03G0120700 [Buddleja alternifolia]|uniref:Disease resistance protein RPM1-like n=1 Tax=Buddleja alternifolia TaxID=168488 RepID=A0AAV6XXC9_9LAMI|nr:hypothetical protein BUALT_Bualt03G0120700 [Buddleja alternifolia]
MAESAVSFVLDRLTAWIREERQLLGSIGENAECIRDELSHIRAFLRVADEKEDIDPQLKEWVTQVRDIAYDAEDVMDKFMLRFAGQRSEASFGYIKRIYVSVKNLKARRQISLEMGAIRSRVKSISKSQQRYKDIYGTSDQESGRAKSTWYDSRGDALLLEEAEVVGIEEPKSQLIRWLSATNSRGHKVISVVGTGGLGKTTLVKKVYDDPTVKMHFSTHVWMTISNSFKLEELLRTMIRRLVFEVKQPPPQGLEAMDADEMKEFVYKFLQHRSYIIVLDDVWRVGAWEAIRYAFPRSEAFGFIVITTRFQSIGHAASIETNGHVYNLEPLSQEESKTLFCKKAFLGGSCPSYLAEIAEVVLKKCEGLPLAIVVIGGLLATKNNNIDEWKKFHRSLGDELESDHMMRMMKLLSLSFYDLPYYLKSCFLYFSVFPEDFSNYTSKLVRLWIAEGFIQPKQGKTMEEVAEEYVKELLDRNLIQLVDIQRHTSPNAVRVRVHDLLHAMILSKSKVQNFVTIANGGGTTWPAKSRRLTIHGSLEGKVESKGYDNLRSVLVSDLAHPLSNLNLDKLLGSGSRLQKVLELEGAVSGTIPDEVFKLYHLKYLSLKNTNVEYIPKLIGKLLNLETLDLTDTNVTELPVEILRLRRLRHLLVYWRKRRRGCQLFDDVRGCKAPYRIACLSSLQTLLGIEATQAKDTTIVKEIGKLTQLKKLGIIKLRIEDGPDLCISLTKLTGLHELHITSNQEDEIMDLQYPMSPTPPITYLQLKGCLEKVPQWIASLHGLTTLLLRWSRINDDPLESLQYLPNLLELELCHAYEGDGLCFKAAGFEKLKKIWLIRLSRLRCVKVEKGSMPFLQELYMWDCKLVEEVPSGIEHLTNLECIDFTDMSEGLVTTLEKQKEEGGDQWKLANIPKIEIYSLSDGEWQARRL